jgi:hypothetical protein
MLRVCYGMVVGNRFSAVAGTLRTGEGIRLQVSGKDL